MDEGENFLLFLLEVGYEVPLIQQLFCLFWGFFCLFVQLELWLFQD